MGWVTGLTLHTGFEEEENLKKINKWLSKHELDDLAWGIESHYNGNKHPQIRIYGAGYNYFPEEDFIKFFLSLQWDEPETVVLLLNPEEGATTVIRPGMRLEDI